MVYTSNSPPVDIDRLQVSGVHDLGQLVVEGTQLLGEELTQVSVVDDGVDTVRVTQSAAQQDTFTCLHSHTRILQGETNVQLALNQCPIIIIRSVAGVGDHDPPFSTITNVFPSQAARPLRI